MESMSARNNRKLVEPVGNHEPYWMSHVARIATVADLWLRVRELAQTVRNDAVAASTAWQRLEFYLRDYSLHMTRKLRDHSAPYKFRQMEEIMQWVDHPQELSSDPRCWALLGSLEATTILLGGMHAARAFHRSDISRATASLCHQLGTYQAKTLVAYEELRSVMASLCEDARPKSVTLVIKETDEGPILMVQYERAPDLGTE
ncbi:hypothetical protein BI313_00160 (plasmid) [Xanthomonas vesicatoria]|nr:hypothetical protein BI313_00160 [Xanthomonas vesicatoria]